jgi:ATP-dependent exoDNAse (exonuclease V) beta subunit
MVVADTPEACADRTADTIAQLVADRITVRDRDTGLYRPVRPGDIAILFRTRESHREFEDALERRAIPSYVYKGLGFFDADEIKDVLALLWYLADPLSDLRAAAWMRSRFARISDDGLRTLAPRLADALRLPEPPAARADLAPSDVEALDVARAASARWRALVDRLPPAELLDVTLNESAYAMELRGPRFAQARENLKKIRALIRRIQNRGYATLARIAAHLDRLAVGDEANAVIDALDAVNLMTVHAAKGLEFPVVFLVNLGRGTGNRRDPIRIAAENAEDAVSVAVGDFRSDSDEDEAAREREETKRLLYVAITRARDRLYLGSVLKEGRLQPGRGSLAEVLPPSLLEKFTEAFAGVKSAQWHARSGNVHAFAVAGGAADAGALEQLAAEREGARPPAMAAAATDFGPVEDTAPPRLTVGAAVGEESVPARPTGPGSDSDRLAGTLVHRLLQRLGVTDASDDEALRQVIDRLVRPDERSDIDDREDLLVRVIAAYRAVCLRTDVRDIYLSGAAMHEVPFTFVDDSRIVHGTMDCLVCAGDRVTVLEFKTGRSRAAHEAQAEFYRRAALAVFPGAVVDARIIYADALV